MLAALPATLIGAIWLVTVSWMAIAEDSTLNSTSRDLSVYQQILWNTAHGRPFETTLLESNRVHLAEHVALLLPLLSPAYAVFPDVRPLFVVQSLTLALGSVPIYLFARRLIGGFALPTLLVASYFALPVLTDIALDNVYPVTQSALPVGLAGYFFLTRRYRPGVALALLAMLMEEEAGLAVAGLGLLLLLRPGTRRLGAALAAYAAVWLALVTLVVMPRFHEPSTLPAQTANRTLDHFAQVREAPAETLSRLAAERVPLALRWLVVPTGGLVLLSPQVLIANLPDAAALLLADKEIRLRRHWAAPMVPILWLSVVVAIAQLRRPMYRRVAIVALVVGSASTFLLDSGLPGGGRFDPADASWTSRAEQLSYLVDQVPAGATVAASRRVLAHLSGRPELYVFPPSYRGALWPPERRPNVYLADLTNDDTLEMLQGRQSPLRTARAPYAIWLAGPDALMLVEHAPAPTQTVGKASGEIRLDGVDDMSRGPDLDLVLHWSAPRRPSGSLARVVRLLADDGSIVAEQRGTALDTILPTNDWPNGQRVIDRVHFDGIATDVARVVVGWLDARGEGELIALTELADRAARISESAERARARPGYPPEAAHG